MTYKRVRLNRSVRRLLVWVVACAVLSPAGLGKLVLALDAPYRSTTPPLLGGVYLFLFTTFVLMSSWRVAWRCVRDAWDAYHPPPLEERGGEFHCTGCGYNVRGLETGRCPECGQPFANGATFRDQ